MLRRHSSQLCGTAKREGHIPQTSEELEWGLMYEELTPVMKQSRKRLERKKVVVEVLKAKKLCPFSRKEAETLAQ